MGISRWVWYLIAEYGSREGFFFWVEFTLCLVGVKNERKSNEINGVFHLSPPFFFPSQIGDKKGEKMLMIRKVQNCP